MSKFYAIEGPLRGKVFEVVAPASIGRGQACAIRLDGRHVSRIHAHLEGAGDATRIRDNDSRNGIFVNGRNVQAALLRKDDQVEIGEHLLVYEPTSDPQKLPRAATRILDSIMDPFHPPGFDARAPGLLAAAAALVAPEDLPEVVQRLLDALMEAVKPERGAILLADARGRLKPAARKAQEGDEDFFFSNVLHHQLAAERRAVLATDVRRRGPHAGSPVGLLGVPLASGTEFVGAAILESKLGEGQDRPPFTATDLRLAAALAAFAGSRVAQIRRILACGRLGEKPLAALLLAYEKDLVAGAVGRSKGDLEQAALLLGLKREELDGKLKAHGMMVPAPAKTETNAISSAAPAATPESGWKSVEP